MYPVYSVVDEEGVSMGRDQEVGTRSNKIYLFNLQGRILSHDGQPLPTDAYGQPMGPDSSPLPTNFYGQFVLGGRRGEEGEALPTDAMGYPIYPVVYPDGQLLPTSSAGLFIDPQRGEEVQRDDQGIPVDGQVMGNDPAWRVRIVRK